MPTTEDFLPRPRIEERQRERLGQLLDEVLPRNRFYHDKFHQAGLVRDDIRELSDLKRLPFTTKAELLAEQEKFPPYGRLTYPPERYSRLHQTSGTKGIPLRWLDTPESWQRVLNCWQTFFDIIGVRAGDRLLFTFSFGPFLGFWSAFDAASQRGCLCIPAGGLSSGARLRMMLDNEATVVLATPTYAMHLAEYARKQGIVLGPGTPGYRVRMLIVSGEPGGSIPATKAKIEGDWHARVFDHSGLSEVGPMTIECPDQPRNLHVLESEYLVEVVSGQWSVAGGLSSGQCSVASGQKDPESSSSLTTGHSPLTTDHCERGELVVTNFYRWGSPLIRYRTGDLVRIDRSPCSCGRSLARLQGGILGRVDEMIVVRGNNFYPTALEEVIRRFAEVSEFRVKVDSSSALMELRVEIEPAGEAMGVGSLAERVAQAIRDELLFRAEVVVVPPGSLPRFEMKARRFS